MLLNKLTRAAEKHRVYPLFGEPDEPDYRLRFERAVRTGVAAMHAAQKFVLDASDVEGEEIAASAKAMDELGLFKLPFPTITVETAFGFHNFEAKKKDCYTRGRLIILAGPCSEKTALVPASLHFSCSVFFNIPQVDGKHVFRWLPGVAYCGLPGKAAFKDSFVQVGLKQDTHDEALQSIALCAGQIVAELIVLLQTKGVERERVLPHKTNLIAREAPEDGYTIVRNYISRGPTGALIPERKRTRLHLRRGHIRRQRWGRGRKFEKKIWIEPMLVGHEEEGRIEHLYEVD